MIITPHCHMSKIFMPFFFFYNQTVSIFYTSFPIHLFPFHHKNTDISTKKISPNPGTGEMSQIPQEEVDPSSPIHLISTSPNTADRAGRTEPSPLLQIASKLPEEASGTTSICPSNTFSIAAGTLRDLAGVVLTVVFMSLQKHRDLFLMILA